MNYGDCAAFSTQLLCGGGSETERSGTCVAAWMGNTFSAAVDRAIPDGRGNASSTIVVRGLATVPTDISVLPMITHGNKRDLRMTLINPLGSESVIFDREGEGWWIPGDRITVRNFLSDEDVNGSWTLRIEDLAAGTSGTFDSWEMDIISRWD